ncbi:MAG: Crp/Fnr family transcriptional regulator [Burkholderiales bacterium]
MHAAGPSEVLRNLPLFSALQGSAFAALAATVQQRSCRRRAMLVEAGDPAAGLHVILSGRVRLLVEESDGRELTIGTLSAGEFFGESCLLAGGAHASSVEAEDACELAFIPREALHRYVLSDANAASAMLTAVVARLAGAHERLVRLGLMNVYGRVVCAMLEAVRESDGECIVDMGSEEIAALVGASREMVSRVVRDLIDREIVERRKRRLAVLNRAALAELAAFHRRKTTRNPQDARALAAST